ncbi:diacylglycerol kinase family lipid kinase [Candidatus Gracilibacteria bacterium]|nr:diacylglycerol kinase family lipid kinase [Candidatus Gracilibacteria bacterium]
MKSCIILNPKAGRGMAARRLAELEHALRAAGLAFDLVETDKRLGAHLLAERAVEHDYTQIIAVGGDGTLNEVVNGVLAGQTQSGRRVPVGIVPIGTGNDFIKALDGVKPNDFTGAATRIARGHTRAIDIGRIEVESEDVSLVCYFVNGLGMGMDAQVTVESDKLHYLSGPLVYYGGIAAAFFSYRAKPMRVRAEGIDVEQRLLFASIGNGRCQGGSFYMTPQATIDDGLLDICIVENMSLPRMLTALPLLTRGEHTALPQVTMARADRVEVSSAWPFPVATDGEVVTTSARRVIVTVEPGAIDLVS